jgi:hypothetical protein
LSVPPGVFTSTVPVAAPAGTVVVIKEAETTLKVAAVPLNVTLVAPVSLVPSERAVSRQCHCVRLGSSCALLVDAATLFAHSAAFPKRDSAPRRGPPRIAPNKAYATYIRTSPPSLGDGLLRDGRPSWLRTRETIPLV